MSISTSPLQSGARGLQRLICSKYYDVLKLEIVETVTIKLISATDNLY